MSAATAGAYAHVPASQKPVHPMVDTRRGCAGQVPVHRPARGSAREITRGTSQEQSTRVPASGCCCTGPSVLPHWALPVGPLRARARVSSTMGAGTVAAGSLGRGVFYRWSPLCCRAARHIPRRVRGPNGEAIDGPPRGAFRGLSAVVVLTGARVVVACHSGR